MYQWRKFEFFEEKAAGRGAAAVPAEIAGRVTCCSGGRGRVAVGCDDGTVGLLDRGFRLSYGFQAYASSVLFLQQLKQKNVLVTVGDDDQASSQSPAICLKVFDLDKVQEEGSSTTSPFCVQILRIFTNQFPQAKITSFVVLEEAPPILLITIGLDNGSIYCIKGDIARERITRFKLQVEAVSDGPSSPITGLGFRVEGQAHQLFAVTPSSVTLFSLHDQPPRRQTLDQIGCQTNVVAMSDRMDLIIGRPEAVYFYEVDGRGPCWAFDGEKKFIGWFRGFLLCIIEDQRSQKNTLNVYDLKNRLIAHSMPVGDVSHLVTEWGCIILIMSDKKIICIGEKDMESKLDMLFKKNLYTVAINLVQSQQADPASTAEVLRKYGDHLYGKQEYDEAMSQYIHTIGHLEPSYVIQKFLDAKRIYNLTNYLEKLHDRGLASKDHTTLLLNCYTKLKDVEKLNHFIKDEDGVGEIKFDVETAIRVCRAAGYHEHAMFVAKKVGRHELYLKILLEDLGRYDEALQYISGLEANQAGLTVKEYGKIIVERLSIDEVQRVGWKQLNDKMKWVHGVKTVVRSLLTGERRLCDQVLAVSDELRDECFVESTKGCIMQILNFGDAAAVCPRSPEEVSWILDMYEALAEVIPKLKELFFGSAGDDVICDLGGILERLEDAMKGNLLEFGKVLQQESSRRPMMAGEIHPMTRYVMNYLRLLVVYSDTLDKLLVDDAAEDVDHNASHRGVDEDEEYLESLTPLGRHLVKLISYLEANLEEKSELYEDSALQCIFSMNNALYIVQKVKDSELGEDCSKEVKEVLTYIEKEDVLPPIVVLQALSENPCLTLLVVKDYIACKLEQESNLIEDDRKSIDKCQEETELMKREIEDLKTNTKVFQLSKCTACTFTLDLSAVHFMCCTQPPTFGMVLLESKQWHHENCKQIPVAVSTDMRILLDYIRLIVKGGCKEMITWAIAMGKQYLGHTLNLNVLEGFRVTTGVPVVNRKLQEKAQPIAPYMTGNLPHSCFQILEEFMVQHSDGANTKQSYQAEATEAVVEFICQIPLQRLGGKPNFNGGGMSRI